MKNFDYKYTKRDLLEFPQKYQRTPFSGKKFLKSYSKSRHEIMQKFDKRKLSSFNFNDFIIKYSDIKKLISFDNLSSPFKTEELLHSILANINNKKFDEPTKVALNKLISKFEIQKKIFSTYNHYFKNHSDEFSYLMNYSLLSLICLMTFELTNNLKYLNTSLKLNDLICSQEKKILIPTDASICKIILNKETQIIRKLCKTKGIKLN